LLLHQFQLTHKDGPILDSPIHFLPDVQQPGRIATAEVLRDLRVIHAEHGLAEIHGHPPGPESGLGADMTVNVPDLNLEMPGQSALDSGYVVFHRINQFG